MASEQSPDACQIQLRAWGNFDRRSYAYRIRRHAWMGFECSSNNEERKSEMWLDLEPWHSVAQEDGSPGLGWRTTAARLEIRTVCREELFQVKALTDDEDWRHTLDYIRDSYDWYPQGFLGAYKLPHTYLISFCYGFPLCNSVAFVQYYLTMSGYRGRGIGSYLLSRTIASLGNRNIGLNCAYETMSMYKKLGFHKDFNIFVYDRVPAANIDLPEPSKSIFYVDSVDNNKQDSCKILYKGDRRIRLEDVFMYDGQMCTVPREKYVRSWLRNQEVQYCVAYLPGPRKHNHPIGYAAIRPSDKGHIIGPLYADSAEIAADLLKALLKLVSGDTLLQFYIPQQNREVYSLVKRLLKVEPSSVYVRMYNQEKIPVTFHKTYLMFNLDQVII